MKKCTKCLEEKEDIAFSKAKNYRNGLRSWCKECIKISRRGVFRKQAPREKKIWLAMKYRCDSPSCSYYANYGGRGIKYDPAWSSFEVFWKDMSPTYKPHLTLDRIDNEKGYCKENCRWATMTEQNRNKRNTPVFEINGMTRTLLEWCCVYTVPYPLVKDRLRYGWNIIPALTKPKQFRTQ